MDVNYQVIINVIAEIVKNALPFGMILSLGEWCIREFFKCVFPRRFSD